GRRAVRRPRGRPRDGRTLESRRHRRVSRRRAVHRRPGRPDPVRRTDRAPPPPLLALPRRGTGGRRRGRPPLRRDARTRAGDVSFVASELDPRVHALLADAGFGALFTPRQHWCCELVEHYVLCLTIDLVRRLDVELGRPTSANELVAARGWSDGF